MGKKTTFLGGPLDGYVIPDAKTQLRADGKLRVLLRPKQSETPLCPIMWGIVNHDRSTHWADYELAGDGILSYRNMGAR